MKKDDRYQFAKTLIIEGKIKTLNDLFSIVPRKIIAEDLKMNPTSFSNKKSKQPANFKLSELLLLSEILEIDIILVVKIFLNSIGNQD